MVKANWFLGEDKRSVESLLLTTVKADSTGDWNLCRRNLFCDMGVSWLEMVQKAMLTRKRIQVPPLKLNTVTPATCLSV